MFLNHFLSFVENLNSFTLFGVVYINLKFLKINLEVIPLNKKNHRKSFANREPFVISKNFKLSNKLLKILYMVYVSAFH